jgi:hypothetical protein
MQCGSFDSIRHLKMAHIGPKHVVLSGSERRLTICCIADEIIDCLICHATGWLNIE